MRLLITTRMINWGTLRPKLLICCKGMPNLASERVSAILQSPDGQTEQLIGRHDPNCIGDCPSRPQDNFPGVHRGLYPQNHAAATRNFFQEKHLVTARPIEGRFRQIRVCGVCGPLSMEGAGEQASPETMNGGSPAVLTCPCSDANPEGVFGERTMVVRQMGVIRRRHLPQRCCAGRSDKVFPLVPSVRGAACPDVGARGPWSRAQKT